MTEDATPQTAPLTDEQSAWVAGAMDEIPPVAAEVLAKYPASLLFSDLTSLGRMGLVMAARSFDPSFNVRFKTYATHRIRGAMLDGIEIEAREHRKKQILAAREAVSDYAALLGADQASLPWESDEVCQRRYSELADGAMAAMSLRLATVSPSPEDEYAAHEERARMSKALAVVLDKLSDADRGLIELYFLEELTLEEVAARMRISVPTVVRSRNKILPRMGALLRAAFAGSLPAKTGV